MNINFTLKLIILVFLVAIGSICLAAEVIEFNQDTLISEIKKDEHKYERLDKYFKDMGEVGLCELLSNYVAYRRLLNEESVTQTSDTEVVLSNLQTILETVEDDKKRLMFTVCLQEEQNRIIDKISPLVNEYIQAVSNEKYQLAADAFNEFGRVIKTYWKEIYIKRQISEGVGVIVNRTVLSPYSIFDLMGIPWILSRDSPGSLVVNEQLFRHTMEEVKIGTYVDFTILNARGMLGQDHMMLITKNGDDNFAFFDPSRGIVLHLTLSELLWLVNDTLKLLKENAHDNTGYVSVLFNNYTEAVEGVKRKFAISSITSHFL